MRRLPPQRRLAEPFDEAVRRLFIRVHVSEELAGVNLSGVCCLSERIAQLLDVFLWHEPIVGAHDRLIGAAP